MISVIVPTLNAEATLAATLASLVGAAVDGIVRQVVIADGGSTDRTLEIAEATGADIIRAKPGRGQQLRAGAAHARFPWLLFLHADTVLAPDWQYEASQLIESVDTGERERTAAAFRFALDDTGLAPRFLERFVRWRCALARLPFGDQGLLMSRTLYDEIGGFSPLPLMEDVDLLRRLGRRVHLFSTQAVTSAARYRREGYVARALRNQLCLVLFMAGAPMSLIVRLYGLETRQPGPPFPARPATS